MSIERWLCKAWQSWRCRIWCCCSDKTSWFEITLSLHHLSNCDVFTVGGRLPKTCSKILHNGGTGFRTYNSTNTFWAFMCRLWLKHVLHELLRLSYQILQVDLRNLRRLTSSESFRWGLLVLWHFINGLAFLIFHEFIGVCKTISGLPFFDRKY